MISTTVTTLIPTFNRSQLLLRAARSVLAQSHAEILVHIFDNASTDQTPAVTAALQKEDRRVLVSRSSTNIGSARNHLKAFASIRTPYFSILADDDYLLPGFFERAVEGLIANPEAGFWAGRLQWVAEDGSPLGARAPWRRTGRYPASDSLLPMFRESLITWTSVVFRAEAVWAVGGFDPTVGVVSDMDLLLRVASTFPVLVHNETVAVGQVSAETASSSLSQSRFWESWMTVGNRLREQGALDQAEVRSAVRAHVASVGVLAAKEALREARTRDALQIAKDVQSWSRLKALYLRMAIGFCGHRQGDSQDPADGGGMGREDHCGSTPDW